MSLVPQLPLLFTHDITISSNIIIKALRIRVCEAKRSLPRAQVFSKYSSNMTLGFLHNTLRCTISLHFR